MCAATLCRCFCGKEFNGLEQPKAFGADFDALYEIESPPSVLPPQSVEVLSYAVSVDQPLRGQPVRQGKLWYLLAEEKVELVCFSLYVNGFSFTHQGSEVSVSLSPFALVRNCKFQETYSNLSLMDMKIFKLSLFTQNLCYYYGVRGTDGGEAEQERQCWVVEIARAVQLVTQSLFPPFSISCEPLDAVVTTLRRLMAGYLLYHDGANVATVLYCELHPHCDVKDHAKLAFYETELCQRLVMEIRVTVGTVCCEKVGVNCSCFCIDGHQFSTRTCAERKLWLRAISNIKVKLQNRAPTPSGEDLKHYRSAIEEHIETIRASLAGLTPIDALLQRLPIRTPDHRDRLGFGDTPAPQLPHAAAALAAGAAPAGSSRRGASREREGGAETARGAQDAGPTGDGPLWPRGGPGARPPPAAPAGPARGGPGGPGGPKGERLPTPGRPRPAGGAGDGGLGPGLSPELPQPGHG